jgi:hypothetical protein
MFFVSPFIICSLRRSAFYDCVGDSSCESIAKLDTCPIPKENMSLVLVQLKHLLQKLSHCYVYRGRQFLRLCRHTKTSSKSNSWRKSILTEDIFVLPWEACFRKKSQHCCNTGDMRTGNCTRLGDHVRTKMLYIRSTIQHPQ